MHRLQEVNKQWSESPFLADNIKALSPEARDLLDKIFQTDPKKRITIPQIMQHPWWACPANHPVWSPALYACTMKQSNSSCFDNVWRIFTKSAWHMSKGT